MTRIRELGFPEPIVETGQNDRGQATNKQVATSHRSGSSNRDEDRCLLGDHSHRFWQPVKTTGDRRQINKWRRATGRVQVTEKKIDVYRVTIAIDSGNRSKRQGTGDK